ncbi:MAG: aminodeoxychorismate/anthranilate synthase component II [Pseudobdellovibrio sp.]
MNIQMKALLIDHDDSFTYNLQDWLRPICDEIEIVNHRELQKHMHAHLVVLSPGPKSPHDYPHVSEFVQNLSTRTAVYGVCLGLQILVNASGGNVLPYQPPLHGKKSKLVVSAPEYKILNDSFVARYHSLACSGFSDAAFETLAISADDQMPMWLRHKQKKWMGVQFHPESFLTAQPETHLKILNDWLRT